ncbi:hypothetical protein [Spiroplasma endosymbiont of Amphibalanus improvisus]|uniref:hypothetical protein n=1 Tax=Spiroplasma endosymbiont of Amphibalanus improvisus TaxID=3066327 RepID=UPI00313CC664
MSKFGKFCLIVILPSLLISGAIVAIVFFELWNYDNGGSDIPDNGNVVNIEEFDFRFETHYTVGDQQHTQPIQDHIEQLIEYELCIADVSSSDVNIEFLDDGQPVNSMNFLSGTSHGVTITGSNEEVAIGSQTIEIDAEPVDLTSWFSGKNGQYTPTGLPFGSDNLDYTDYLYNIDQSTYGVYHEQINADLENDICEQIKWICDQDSSIYITSQDLDDIGYTLDHDFIVNTPQTDPISDWGAQFDYVIPEGYVWFKNFTITTLDRGNYNLFTLNNPDKNYKVQLKGV